MLNFIDPLRSTLMVAALSLALGACGSGGGSSAAQLTIVSPASGATFPEGSVDLNVDWSGYGASPTATLVLDGAPQDLSGFSLDAAGLNGALLPQFPGPHLLELEVNGEATVEISFLVAPTVPGGTGGLAVAEASPLGSSADLSELLPSAAIDGFGFALTRLADLDGDGFDEWALGWRGANRVELRDGRDFGLLWFVEESTGTEFGSSLGRVADLTGDGLPDLLVGAPGTDLPEANAGSVHVLDSSDGSEWLRMNGFDAADGMGTSVVGLGDVNGDGTPDVLATARLAEPLGNKTGRAAVYSGLDASVIHQFDGDAAFQQLGTSAARLDDVSGDGVDDFVLGAWGDTTNGPSAGAARVYSGVSGLLLYEVLGDGSGDHLGVATLGLPDIDGDGIGDFAVAATEVANGPLVDAGLVRFYSGVDGSVLFEFLGEHPVEFAGTSLDLIADQDGDGLEDLVAGAPFFENQRGGSYLLSSATGAALTFAPGLSSDGFAGTDVAALGDLDGDGRAEWLSGAPSNIGLGGGDGSVLLHARPALRFAQAEGPAPKDSALWMQGPAAWAGSPWWLTLEDGNDWVPPFAVGGVDPGGVDVIDGGLLNDLGAAALPLPATPGVLLDPVQLRVYVAPAGTDPLVASPGYALGE